ncbi:MAG TPA: GAF domain-containing protein [Thermoanaerobaculia bacterium]|jgi:nitrate/nitrite-specific signal transduction histidine kinase|nr:GAF domain-containing protein [Thermoanaerobaculia bacterium]
MKPHEGRPFVDKVASDTREYVQLLLEEITRLNQTLTDFSSRYVDVEQQNTNLANLYVATYQLHGTLDRERVLGAIKEVIINLIGSEELGIWEITGDNLTLLDSFGIDSNQWERVSLDGEGGLIGLVAETGQRYVAGEVDIIGGGSQEKLSACIPLKLDDTVIGVIGIFGLLPQKEGFEPIDLELFDLLGSHAATALYCTRATSRLMVVS